MSMKSQYMIQFEQKNEESNAINKVRCRDIREREKEKEYQFPPLPNIENVKKAYLVKKKEELRNKNNLNKNEDKDIINNSNNQ